MPVPGKVSFLHPFRQLGRIAFQFFGNLEPVAPGGDAVHPLLIERVRQKIAAGNAKTRLRQQPLDAARRVKAKIIAVGAAEHLIDLGLERHVHRVLRLFEYRIEHDKPPAVFQHPHHLVHYARWIAEVMQAERHEDAVEGAGFEG